MDNNQITKNERVVLIVLSAFLFLGAVLLYVRNARPYRDITITKGGIKEEISLAEAAKMLEEARRVDINSASKEEMMTLPGVGETLSVNIIEYRRTHGDFESAEDLLNVSGIGPKKLDKIRPFVKLE